MALDAAHTISSIIMDAITSTNSWLILVTGTIRHGHAADRAGVATCTNSWRIGNATAIARVSPNTLSCATYGLDGGLAVDVCHT